MSVFDRPSPAQLGVTCIAAAFTRDGEASNSEDGNGRTHSDRHHASADDAGASNDNNTNSKMLKFINKSLRGKDRGSAESAYELPLGWSFYTDPASGRLHYIDHSTGRTYDKPPPPRFKFDPNKTPSPREFDTWSQSSSSSISSLDLGTPLIFTKSTTSPNPHQKNQKTLPQEHQPSTPEFRNAQNTTLPPPPHPPSLSSPNTSTPSQPPTQSPSPQTQTPTPAAVPPTPPHHPPVLKEHVVIAQSTNHSFHAGIQVMKRNAN
ncbi:hypothetical protein HII31_00367 [Pseudocercospora fuligena]|uniref:WW domain-containing protein n=1 Tax=Pseudocercospora fuligena TaxID=685502 RepID=A0A8H6VNA5_9PEZI|nr:hypothetical protein HII31_00367 [Pseudocercospora fuligena]